MDMYFLKQTSEVAQKRFKEKINMFWSLQNLSNWQRRSKQEVSIFFLMTFPSQF